MNFHRVLPKSESSLQFAHNAQWLNSLLRWRAGRIERPLLRPEIDPGVILQRSRAGGLRTLVALSPQQLEAAERLVSRRYTDRGYRYSPTDEDTQSPAFGPRRCMTLLAENDHTLLGTLTLRSDSPRRLLAEQAYGSEVERLRSAGRRVGELVRLAIEEGVDWKAALDALVQSSYVITRVIHALTDILIEVNPRHVRFYERTFGFEVAARGRLCTRVAAPSVLMRLDLEQFSCRLRFATA